MHANVVSVIQGKGGVGKTSTVASLAGLVARSGRRVLTVDVDPQGNLGRDLGYFDSVDEAGDGGRSLLGALHGYRVQPLPNVREGLDCVTAGPATEQFAQLLNVQEMQEPGSAVQALAAALAPLAEEYDLVVVDCPPGNQLLQTAALGASQYVLVPTAPDAASIDGLLRVDTVFGRVRSTANPGLHLLGAFVFDVALNARIVIEDAEADIATCLGGHEHVIPVQIRHARGLAGDCRRLGRLPHELEEGTVAGQYARGRHRQADQRVSGNAAGLASDYQRLAESVLGRIAAHRQATRAAS
jgi:cellulose biosynthesis protein BcsQ